MNGGSTWAWVLLVLLGAYHGLNPGMGWLFAVALGMQQRSTRAVWWTLLPLTLGHALAIGTVIVVVGLAQVVVPSRSLRLGVAAILFAFGVVRLVWHGHPRYGGMRVGFGRLTLWSFLIASAHGAGLMLLPVLSGASGHHAGHGHHDANFGGPWLQASAVVLHTLGYLVVTGIVATIFAHVGLRHLRAAWINLDLLWSFALFASGAFVLLW